MSNFSFIDNSILRANLDRTFDHILELLPLSESKSYKNKLVLASSFRKTIIIHTASIIEALLLWKLKQKINKNEVTLGKEWKYFDIKIIYKINDSEEIIAGRRKKVIKKIDSLGFVRIIDLCEKYKIIDEKLVQEIHKIRGLRNKQHISGLTNVERTYSKSDLNLIFGVTRKVKKSVIS